MRKTILSGLVLAAAGLAALVLPGCGLHNPTDPFSGSGSSTAGITTNTADSTTTSIAAAASINNQGVYLSVVNQTGSPITASNFNGANFDVKYNGATVPSGSLRLSTASGSGQAIASSLVLDYSGSMGSVNIANLETAANTFVNNMQAADRGEIIKFGSMVVREQAYTSDKSLLHTAITRATTAGGSTAFYDATYMGITDTARETGQRAVIAFTDGFENNSTIIATQQELINAARTNGVPIFTVALGSADIAGLQAIASQTGGFFYNAPNSAQLAAIYQQIAQVFTNTVILTWPGFVYRSGATLTITVTYICATGTHTSTVDIILP
jgi:uncharacterized protein YegL